MNEFLPLLIQAAGVMQLSILCASALVPFQLDWKTELAPLKGLHRQMYWVYGGYVVLSIVAFGVICIVNADEIAERSGLARSFCGFICVFWGIRICLQPVFDVKEHLTAWWLTAGYHLLTLFFAVLTVFFGWVALG